MIEPFDIQALRHDGRAIEMWETDYNCYSHGCPCGYYGDPVKECSCSSMAIARYQKRISGPLLDRIDIHVSRPFT